MKSYWNTVFIHIPRTSGIALKWALNSRIHDLEYINTQYHKTAIERQEQMGTERWNECYKFTIVRNPWDRVVSWYHRHGTSLSFREWLLQNDVGQARYFTDDNEVLVDDIFQYETLDDHLEVLCSRANWPQLDRRRVVNETMHEPYPTYYNQELIDYVARQCAFEIDRFGYEF